MDHQAHIKFCMKTKIYCTDTLRIRQNTYGNKELNIAQVNRWLKRFEDEEKSKEDDP